VGPERFLIAAAGTSEVLQMVWVGVLHRLTENSVPHLKSKQEMVLQNKMFLLNLQDYFLI